MQWSTARLNSLRSAMSDGVKENQHPPGIIGFQHKYVTFHLAIDSHKTTIHTQLTQFMHPWVPKFAHIFNLWPKVQEQ